MDRSHPMLAYIVDIAIFTIFRVHQCSIQVTIRPFRNTNIYSIIERLKFIFAHILCKFYTISISTRFYYLKRDETPKTNENSSMVIFPFELLSMDFSQNMYACQWERMMTIVIMKKQKNYDVIKIHWVPAYNCSPNNTKFN